jgi:hypothetical protein
LLESITKVATTNSSKEKKNPTPKALMIPLNINGINTALNTPTRVAPKIDAAYKMFDDTLSCAGSSTKNWRGSIKAIWPINTKKLSGRPTVPPKERRAKA